MQLLRKLDSLTSALQGGALSIGNFDGVHRGHARIVERLTHWARTVRGPAIVFTFDPHPVRLLRPEIAPPPLTWTDRKAELLAALGVDAVIAYPTDEALLRLTAEEFFRRIVQDRLRAKAMIEGPNFFFGRDRAGDVGMLSSFCKAAEVSLEVVQPVKHGPEYVSSSRVRHAIAAGQVAQARELLTQPYRIRGMVTHGEGRGARLGVPTANLAGIDTLLPKAGVYAGFCRVNAQKAWPAAINIGANPTFGENFLKVEVHLIGYEDSLYGQPLEVDFLQKLRDVQPFSSPEALKQQLDRDIETAARWLDRDTPPETA